MNESGSEHEVTIAVSSKRVLIRQAHCPNGCSLMNREVEIGGAPSVTVLATCGERKGPLLLDPRYGSYDNIASFEVPRDEVIAMSCPHCGVDLTEPEETCSLCAAPVFQLHLPNGGIIEGCLRNGCIGHRMKIVDLDAQFARLYNPGIQDVYP